MFSVAVVLHVPSATNGAETRDFNVKRAVSFDFVISINSIVYKRTPAHQQGPVSRSTCLVFDH